MTQVNEQRVADIMSSMLTIELALWFNCSENKNSIVRRTCNRLKYRMTADVKTILHAWSRADAAFDEYAYFVNKLRNNNEN